MIKKARYLIEYDEVITEKVSDTEFIVENKNQKTIYTVDIKKLHCTCDSFGKNDTMCKHIFVLLETKMIDWNELPESFRNHSWYVTDQAAISKYTEIVAPSVKTTTPPATTTSTNLTSLSVSVPTNSDDNQELSDLPPRKDASLKRNRRMIENIMDNIRSEMYNVTDRSILAEARAKMEEVGKNSNSIFFTF